MAPLPIGGPLARRLELDEALTMEAYAGSLARLRRTSGSLAAPMTGGIAVFAGAESPLSRVIGAGMFGPVSSADLDEIEQFFSSRGASSRVDLCPLADPSLVALLNERGYRIDWFAGVHARPLSSAEREPELPAWARVGVATLAESTLWARTVASGFAEDGWEEPPLDLHEPIIHQQLVTCFIAFINDQPAGGAALSIRDGLASLFCASTLPGYRNQGVQTALLRARLAVAAVAGCDLATAIAVPGSAAERNLSRAGFQLAYTKLVMLREFDAEPLESALTRDAAQSEG